MMTMILTKKKKKKKRNENSPNKKIIQHGHLFLYQEELYYYKTKKKNKCFFFFLIQVYLILCFHLKTDRTPLQIHRHNPASFFTGIQRFVFSKSKPWVACCFFFILFVPNLCLSVTIIRATFSLISCAKEVEQRNINTLTYTLTDEHEDVYAHVTVEQSNTNDITNMSN